MCTGSGQQAEAVRFSDARGFGYVIGSQLPAASFGFVKALGVKKTRVGRAPCPPRVPPRRQGALTQAAGGGAGPRGGGTPRSPAPSGSVTRQRKRGHGRLLRCGTGGSGAARGSLLAFPRRGAGGGSSRPAGPGCDPNRSSKGSGLPRCGGPGSCEAPRGGRGSPAGRAAKSVGPFPVFGVILRWERFCGKAALCSLSLQAEGRLSLPSCAPCKAKPPRWALWHLVPRQLKMKTVLMVAEKPSLAQSIAKILSRGRRESIRVRSCLFCRWLCGRALGCAAQLRRWVPVASRQTA